MLRSSRSLLFLAFIVAAIAMSGSLYFSEARLFQPCKYCWYQRILMYPLVLLFGIAAIRNDRSIVIYTLPLSLIGMGYGLFHYGLQKGLVPQENGCAALCDYAYINWAGFITIPFMSSIAFTLITILSLAVFFSKSTKKEAIELNISK